MADLVTKIQARLRPKTSHGLVGIWLDEHKLINAARKTREAGYKKFEAITPFPIHGIDDAMGIPRSYIPWVTFIFGLTGCLFGLWFTWWVATVSWPLNIGGKPFWALPSFIPIVFECTILFAALSSVGALLVQCGLPMIDPPVIDPALTSHKFALFVPENDHGFDSAQLEKMFKELGADEVRRAEF